MHHCKSIVEDKWDRLEKGDYIKTKAGLIFEVIENIPAPRDYLMRAEERELRLQQQGFKEIDTYFLRSCSTTHFVYRKCKTDEKNAPCLTKLDKEDIFFLSFL